MGTSRNGILKENLSSKTKSNRIFFKLCSFFCMLIFFLGNFRVSRYFFPLVSFVTLFISLYFTFIYILLVLLCFIFFSSCERVFGCSLNWNFKPNTWQNLTENPSSKEKLNRNFIKWSFLDVNIFLRSFGVQIFFLLVNNVTLLISLYFTFTYFFIF